MAQRPLTLHAGIAPLTDLLFTPRVAFIWNHSRQAVAWMNPAARAAFTLRLDDFSASLPLSLRRGFARFAKKKEGGTTKVAIAGGPSLLCSVEVLKLADGQDGLIVVELDDKANGLAMATPVSVKPRKKISGQKKTKTQPAALQKNGVSVLNADELRAFKAMGRKVLRLSDDKKQKPHALAPQGPSHGPRPSAPLDRSMLDCLAVFDLVLSVGPALEILSAKGQPARLGWRKAALSGKCADDLTLRRERPILRRMLKRLHGSASQSAKATLVIQTEAGDEIPCRVMVWRAKEGEAAYGFGLLSLDLPARLKPQTADTTRLAA